MFLYAEYRIIENFIQDLLPELLAAGNSLQPTQLEEFKEQLKQLLRKALLYTGLLRKLEDYDNTIALNLYNYSDILHKISDILNIDEEELSILNNFSIKIAPYMRSQIAGDLGYFRHGTSLIDQAIASIRGIVEIEQAKSDRTNQIALRNSEIAEKYRGDRLQSTIQSIGVGLAAGGIAASSGTVAYDIEWFEYYYRKSIKKVKRKGYPLESIIAVDDTPQKWERSYGNLVRVHPFEGDETDDELQYLLLYLEQIRSAENIRSVEKRFWRNRLVRATGNPENSNPPPATSPTDEVD